MHLLRGQRLWGLGASAGLVTAARARAARYGPHARAPPASSRPRPGLRLRLAPSPGPLLPLVAAAAAAAACRDVRPASAATMERPGAGEPGPPSRPRGAT